MVKPRLTYFKGNVYKDTNGNIHLCLEDKGEVVTTLKITTSGEIGLGRFYPDLQACIGEFAPTKIGNYYTDGLAESIRSMIEYFYGDSL